MKTYPSIENSNMIETLKRKILQYLYLFLFLRLDLQVLSFGSYFDMAEEKNN